MSPFIAIFQLLNDANVRYVVVGSVWQHSVLMDLGDTQVRVCSIDDLIEMKRQAGRHKDLDDIEQLIKIKTYTRGPTDDSKN